MLLLSLELRERMCHDHNVTDSDWLSMDLGLSLFRVCALVNNLFWQTNGRLTVVSRSLTLIPTALHRTVVWFTIHSYSEVI